MDEQTRFDMWRNKLADAREADAIRERQSAVREHQERPVEYSQAGLECDCAACQHNRERVSKAVSVAAEAIAYLSTSIANCAVCASDGGEVNRSCENCL